jgi:rhodanese-related sulfurtransferase
MREFSAEQLKTYLQTCDVQPLLLDVRQPWEYDVCRLDNSMLLPMSRIPAEVTSLDAERETVVICHHGIRSRSVGKFLEQAGFTDIINLSGGMAQWARTVDNLMATY